MTTRVRVDVIVVGGGPAGMAAACVAAEQGSAVLLVDENPHVGGQIWRHQPGHPVTSHAMRWISRLQASGASRMQGASVADAFRSSNGTFRLIVETRKSAAEIDATSIILATGARERFLPFPGWTLPGVIGVGAAQALRKAGTSFTGKRVVVAGSGPLLLPVAASLVASGVRLQAVAEQASPGQVRRFASGLWRTPRRLMQAAQYRSKFIGTMYRTGWWIVEAQGESALGGVTITNGVKRRTIPCDVLCCAYGLVPNTELARLMECDITNGSVRTGPNMETSVTSVFCAGESRGIGGVDAALVEGEIAGLAAAGKEASGALLARSTRLRREAESMNTAFALRDELRVVALPETIICRCEDVRLGELDKDWMPRQAKLYTRCGMGACQGRICGAALEFLHAWPQDRIRLPTLGARVSTFSRNLISQADTDHGAFVDEQG